MRMGLVGGVPAIYGAQHISTYVADVDRCIARSHGLPVDLPFDVDPVEIVQRLDGLVITGGQDIHPDFWGGRAAVETTRDPRHHHSAHDLERDNYEAGLLAAALDVGLPVLGICRGHQLLNVHLGGTLVEHLPDRNVAHNSLQVAPTDGAPDHAVEMVAESTVATIYGRRRVVNSWHHQAVDRLGTGLVATAYATDGVVEAAELPGRPVVGLQWHPEWTVTPDPIFDWLVAAAAHTPHYGLAAASGAS